MKYDKEEKEILKAYETGKLKTSKPSQKELNAIKAAAESTFKKDKRVTIRLYDHDLKGIQKKLSAKFKFARSRGRSLDPGKDLPTTWRSEP